MYINKCTKCGAEFETKNPKRIICPNCLYPDRKPILDTNTTNDNTDTSQQQQQERPQMRSSYSYEGNPEEQQRPYPPRNNYQRPSHSNYGGYSRQEGNYQDGNRPNYQRNNYNRSQGGYNNRQGGYNNRPQRSNNHYDRPQGGPGGRRPHGNFGRPQQGGFRRPMQNRRPSAPRQHKELLVNKEQLAMIEVLYKRSLPLPNPDIHESIGQEIGLEPRKVFFGINLVRQKLFLPKLPYPKRKFAVTTDQITAIKNLYEPLLPLPPIGCHKIIASQLKMDEWRVHVGIGLVRKQMGLDRWNEGRQDAPEQIIRPRKGLNPEDKVLENDVRLGGNAKIESEVAVEQEIVTQPTVEEEKPKRGRKKKIDTEVQAETETQE